MKRALAVLLLVQVATELAAPKAMAQTAAEMRDARRETRVQGAAATQAARSLTAAEAEEHRLAEARVTGARAVQAADARLAAAEATARGATQSLAAAMQDRAARAAALAPFLPLLHRLERWPAESLLATPGPAEDALRGLLAMQALIRHAGAEAEAFRIAAEHATQASRIAEAEALRLNAAQAEARSADARLNAALAQARIRRAETQAQESIAARRAREAMARTTDLEQALARLDRERAQERAQERIGEETARRAEEARARRNTALAPPARAPEPRAPDPRAPDSAAPRGSHAFPVAGHIAREFGAAGDGGPARGMTLAASPRARVVAPCAGRIAYAGSFRSYGQLVIIDCGGGNHLVLARMDRLDAATGERVLAGEPIGTLPADQPHLYVEFRRNGQPTDPRGFFSGRG